MPFRRRRNNYRRPRRSRRSRRVVRGRRPRRVKYNDNRALYFHRYIGLQGVWTDLQASGSDQYGLTLSVGGTGSTVAVVGNRFVVTCGANTTTYLRIGYALQYRHIPAVSEFTNLFDQYRIAGFVFRIVPGQNTAFPTDSPLPVVHSVLDYDDANPPAATEAGLNELRERGTYKVQRFDGMNRIFSRYVPRPSIRMGAIDDSGAQVALVRGIKRWLDAAVTDVPHFGVKVMVEMHNPTGSAVSVNFELMAKAYFCAKHVH